ncbi:MAG: tyrosine-type recombinase/integrase [Caldilineales bacterium]|nr:tyrosine-type recombinase/integrase [Caldilineales bacterium]
MSGQQLIQLKIAARSVTSLDLAMTSFLIDIEARRLTPQTLKYYRDQLGPFLAFLGVQEVTTPEEINANHIRTYLVSLQQRGLADASLHSAARAIRAFGNFLVREELLEKSPMRKVQMPRVEKPIKPAFAPEEVRRLLAVCDTERDSAIVLCLLDSGCRAVEFVSLDVQDVDMKTGRVLVRRGKGRKQRVTFFGARARKTLVKYLMKRGEVHPDAPLWTSLNTGERLTDWGLRQMLGRLGQRAEVLHCHPHTFRRTFALWSLRAGMNIYALQQIMGHSDLSVLRRYLALVEQDLQQAHNKHGAVDSLF